MTRVRLRAHALRAAPIVILLAAGALARGVVAYRQGLWIDEYFSLAMATGHGLEHPAGEADPARGDFVEQRAAVPLEGYARFAALLLVILALWPTRAFALIVPVCDNDAPLTRMPEPACELVRTVDDVTGESSVAPICDPQGLSAIAPQRVLPVSDASIGAGPPCGSEASGPELGPRPGEQPFPQLLAFALAAHLAPAAPMIPPAPLGAEIRPARYAGGPRSAIARGIFHPPR